MWTIPAWAPMPPAARWKRSWRNSRRQHRLVPCRHALAAIRELSHYTGFPTQELFIRWLHDPDDRNLARGSSRAGYRSPGDAHTGLSSTRLSAPEKTARQNAAWAIGISGAPATGFLLSLLHDKDPDVLKEALLALSRCPGEVPAEPLLPFLANEATRGTRSRCTGPCPPSTSDSRDVP